MTRNNKQASRLLRLTAGAVIIKLTEEVMMKKSHQLGVVCALCLAFSVASHATAFIVDQSNVGTINQGYSSGTGVIGQSFSPTFNFLDHVELQINAQSATGTTTVHVDIMDGPMGSILGSSNSLSFTPSAIQLGHFEFTPIDISSYSSLFISVVKESVTNFGVFLVDGFGVDSYAGGAAYSSSLGGFQDDDLWFRTGAVPVPAVMWFFGPGLLGLVWMSRRKKA